MWRVKVCGLTRLSDVEVAVEEGADAVGFVLEPTSPRRLTDWSILNYEFENIVKVGVCGEFIEGENFSPFDAVQAIGAQWHSAQESVRVFRPTSTQTMSEWLNHTLGWNICLLDPYDPTKGGGTGSTIDWELAAEFVSVFPGKVILAGGLNPDNVTKAIEVVRPYGVDASSGLESMPGIKDEVLVSEYIIAARSALSAVHSTKL